MPSTASTSYDLDRARLRHGKPTAADPDGAAYSLDLPAGDAQVSFTCNFCVARDMRPRLSDAGIDSVIADIKDKLFANYFCSSTAIHRQPQVQGPAPDHDEGIQASFSAFTRWATRRDGALKQAGFQTMFGRRIARRRVLIG
jgi:hypothetical protein